MKRKIFEGTICNDAIRCNNGEHKGVDFLYTGYCEKRYINDPNHRVSPVFSDLVELFKWIKTQPIERLGSGINSSFRWTKTVEIDI
jgi:hypothetical protein